jgi:nucleoporin NUP159
VKSPPPSEAPQMASSTSSGSPLSLPPLSLTPRLTSAPQSSLATPSGLPPLAKPPVFAQGGPRIFPISPPKQTGETKENQTSPGLLGQVSQVSLAIPAAPPSPSVEEGLQKECAILVSSIENELKEVRILNWMSIRRFILDPFSSMT